MPEILMNTRPNIFYSSPEIVERVKSTLNHVRNELAEFVKSELVGDWYNWILRVDLEEFGPYRAIVAREVEGQVSYIFESIRVFHDGEFLYRGCTIDEGHQPDLYLDLVAEARRQHSWAKTCQARQAEVAQKVQECDEILSRLRNDYPGLARNILVHSQSQCTFNLNLPGLTEAEVRETLERFFPKKGEIK